MIKFELNEMTKGYFNRRIRDYEEGKLVPREEHQLFQDLYDSGYINYLPQYFDFMKKLVKLGLVFTPQGRSIN